MGENGAGKSTLIKALTGVYQIDSGEIIVNGEVRSFTGTASAQAAGISTVYQEVNLCTNLTHRRERHARPRGARHRRHQLAQDPRARRVRRSRAWASAISTPGRRSSSISIAMQQLVAISRAMVTDSKVLILDEPTSSLDANEVEVLFDVIRRLRDQGVAILFVSHFLDQVYAISDRITVLRNGELRRRVPQARISIATQLISKMIGKDFESLRALGSNRQTERARPHADADLRRARASAARARSSPPTSRCTPVRSSGFAGLLGAGRTELARLHRRRRQGRLRHGQGRAARRSR